MKSNEYYIPFNQNYISNENGNESKNDSSATCVPNALSFHSTNCSDPIAGFLTDKIRIIEASIKQVADEIENREQLRDRMLTEIDKQTCAQKEMLYFMAPHGPCPFTVGDSRRRSGIEKELASLETDKRREETSAWRDVSTLRKELRELFREYEDEKRKQRVMAE